MLVKKNAHCRSTDPLRLLVLLAAAQGGVSSLQSFHFEITPMVASSLEYL